MADALPHKLDGKGWFLPDTGTGCGPMLRVLQGDGRLGTR